MMTEEQAKIFRMVLDTNWEVSQLQAEGKLVDAWKKAEEHHYHVQELKALMGEDEYEKFIDTGRRMFAPKKEEKCQHERTHVAVRHESGISLRKCSDCNASV